MIMCNDANKLYLFVQVAIGRPPPRWEGRSKLCLILILTDRLLVNIYY